MSIKKLFVYLLSLTLILSATIVIPGPIAKADTQSTFYIDPVNGQDTNDGLSTASAFQTIEHARDVVRTINSNMTDDIHVYLRGGTYSLTSTLSLTDADSGTNGYNIIYSAYNGEKPVISGGKQITGWTLYDASKNIYSAYAGGDIETRQLFVNGSRATRAKSVGAISAMTFIKASGYTATGNVLANSTIPMHNWGNKSDIEFVYNAQWTAPRIGVSTITNNGSTTTITMKQPGWGFVTNKGGTSVGGRYNSNGKPWYIENAYELLDAEGEWYLDRSTDYFYYKPKAGENMSTASVVAPTLEELVRVQGSDLDHKASNIQFKGITFSYATYLRVSGDRGLPDAQNNVLRDDLGETIINAAVNLKYAHSIKFERDVFEHLGGTGLNMYTGSQDNLVVGSVFTDISGNGIQVGDYTGLGTAGTENYAQSTDPRVLLRNNDVNNSYFYKTGAEYFASTAIAASLPQDMDITHNEISNVPYSGIHVGWGWNNFTKTIHQRTNIQYNYIHDDMTLLHDGGAIYTNGPTNGSSTNKGIISNNYIQNEGNTNGALYPDEGSSWYDITDNVVNNSSRYLLIWKNTIHDINVNNTYTTTSRATNAGTRTTVNNTTVVTNGNWPAAAQTIINNAGLESAYQYLKETTLMSITAPAPISAANGSAKTATALGLPGKVALVTEAASYNADVTWDLNGISYDPTSATEQTFMVTGNVTLPVWVLNPNNVPLTTSISVSVKSMNLALNKATVTASTYYSADYSPDKVVDGINGNKSEWASKGEKNPWIQLNWTTSQTINKITFYDRPNTDDWAAGGTLTFSDGSTLTVSGIPNNGSAYSVTFPEKTVTWVKFQVSGGSGPNVGLSEIEIYDIDNTPPITTDNAPSGWVNQETTVALNAVDTGSGVAVTYFTVDGGARQSGNTITFNTEGVHTLVYWSVDKAGNVEAAKTVSFNLDSTAPAIVVSVPGDSSIYEDSGDLTPQITLTDNLSGVDNSKTTVTLDTYGYQTGTTFPLYTLPLGQHTLVVSSSDIAGNQGSKTVHFQTVASIDSIKALVTRFANTNWIDNEGIANSLQAKLAHNDLKSFVNEVEAQSGKHISSEAATYLLRDAQYVLTQK